VLDSWLFVRSASVIPVCLLAAAFATGCRPLKGGPARVGTAGGVDESPRPSGRGTRSVGALASGLRVVLEENHAAPVVALQLWLGTGTADDPPGLEGAANVMQHLLARSARGSAGRPPAESRWAAWTSYDETVVQTLTATPLLTGALRALAELITRPSLGPADFEAARDEARADLQAARRDPPRAGTAAALATAFTAHPYRRPLLGTEASLGALTQTALLAFYERAYGAGNATLVIVGDFDAAVVREQAAALFAGWRTAGAPSPREREPRQTAPRVAVASADLPETELALAWKTDDFRGEDRAALEILAAILGGGQRARLDDELVRNRQLARETRAFLFASRDGGVLVAGATLTAGAVEDSTTAILDEVGRLASEGPTTDELARARTLVEREEVAQNASVEGYARRLGLYATVAGDPDLEATHLQRLREVAGPNVRAVAARCFRAENLSVAATLPSDRGAKNDDRLARLRDRLRAAVASASARATRSTAKAERGDDVRNVVTYVLPSGVRLLILPDDAAEQVSIRALWSGGARIEDGHLTGAASLIARLLLRGTKTRTAERLAADLGAVGGHLQGFAGLDVLGVRGEFLASRWEQGLDLVVDCLRNPRFAEEDVEQDRRVLLDAIRLRDDDAASVARRLFEEAVFAGRPYHADLLGTSESVAALTRRRVLDFFRAAYGPAGLTVAIVGAVDADRVAARLQTLFADCPATRPAPPPASPQGINAAASTTSGAAITPAQPGTLADPRPRELVRLGTPGQARLVLGFPGVALADPDRLALDVLAQVLDKSDRRLPALRDGRSLVEAIEARSTVGVDGGTFSVRVVVRPDLLDTAVAAVRGELTRLLEAGVTPDEVAAARRTLIARRGVAFERRGAVALALAMGAALADGARSPRRDLEDLAKINADDVMRVARRILQPKREVLAVVRPRTIPVPATSRSGEAGGRRRLALDDP